MSQNDFAEKDNKTTPSSHFSKKAPKYQGTSLNNKLLPGRDLLKNFIRTLFKFREGAVALTADIEQMFLKSKCNNLIFLYSNVENEIERIVIYNYNRHIIGARSSQTCANYSLTRTLEIDNLHKLSNLFCMDDFIFPLNDQLETENFRKEVVENLSRDGFKLTKFQCNVEEFHEKAVENEASILGRFRPFSSMSNEGLTS